jgi:hypothetical protein
MWCMLRVAQVSVTLNNSVPSPLVGEGQGEGGD